MRIVFIGAVEFSRKALERLLERGADVVGVCTLDASAFNSDHCDLGPLCDENGVPWTYVPDVNSAVALRWITERRPDVIFCFGWSRLLGSSILALAPLGVVGFHPAALPANRGRHPLIWALVLGLEETASTFFLMDETADSGDIVSQRPLRIDPTDDAGSLYAKITACALEQIDELMPALAAGTFERRKQNPAMASTWRKRGTADGIIDWRMSARSIHNLVRGLARPYVGAHFVRSGAQIKVWSTKVVRERPANVEPGKIIDLTQHGAVVACGEQAILLLDTQPELRAAIGEYL